MKTIIKQLIIPLCVLMALNSNLKAQNLIENPGFENGLTDWATQVNNVANANFSIESLNSPEGTNHVKCVVSTLGNNDWSIQIRSNEFAVDQTHKYRLTFKAKSATPGALLKVFIQKSAFMGESFNLSNSWQSYTYEFYPNESSKELKFNFVNVTEYYIDDIIIEDVTPPISNINAPPSCVITAPHVNAYYKNGSTVKINAYATDIGGTGPNGTVSKVEFYIDDQKIGESSTPENNTYSIDWNANNIGEYRITAITTDNSGKSFTSAGVLISVGSDDIQEIGLSAGKGKYLGNIVRNSGVEPTFTDYWNAVSSGNGCKWVTIERNRDIMNWSQADDAYNLAKNNNLAFRYHAIAWGSQYPSWIKTLNPTDFQAEMEEFIAAIANRYPYIDQIDVLNEALPGHQDDTQYFIDGLGGSGVTGYDWAVWLFEKCRQYFPNAKLVLNDFGLVNSSSNIYELMLLVKVLRDKGIIDGFGAQAHTFNIDGLQPSELESNLDLMATSGVPIYITELDIEGDANPVTEESQLAAYQNLFPVLWEHPSMGGITLWGYVFGSMWRPDAGLVYSDGIERPSMIWLRDYLTQQEAVGYPFSNFSSLSAESFNQSASGLFKVYPNPANHEATFHNYTFNNVSVSIFDIYGREVKRLELNANSKAQLNLRRGVYLVNFNNKETFKLIVKK